MKKIKSQIKIFILAIVLVFIIGQLCSEDSEASKVEYGEYDSKLIPSNGTEFKNVTSMQDQIEKWKEKPEMKIDAAKVLPEGKIAVLWVYEISEENQNLHHKVINGWEIIVVEGSMPTDEEIAWIRNKIDKWREDSEMQISGSQVDLTGKTVTIWVYEITPKNEKLHGEVINGWKIIIAESIEPKLIPGFKAIFAISGLLAVAYFIKGSKKLL